MKKTLLTLLAFLAAGIALSAQELKPWMAQEAYDAIRADRTRAGVNTNSYEFGEIRDTKAPKGYKPFYISHYGRHGSRSNWGTRDYDKVVNVLTEAQDAGILTTEGVKVLEEARLVREAHGGMDGRLSQRGVREHAALAERMYNRYPEVFKKGSRKVRSMGSTVQRCLISMCSFTNQLSRMDPDLFFYLDTGEEFMNYINVTGDKESQKKMRPMYGMLFKSMAAMDADTLSVFGQLFTDPEKGREMAKGADAFNNALFSTACIAEDWDIDDYIYDLLPFDYIYKKFSFNNRQLYLSHCNSVEFGDIRVPFAKSLADDIVAKTDEAIAGGEYCADLRFGHDLPLLGLLAYLGLEGVGEKLSLEEIDHKWPGYFYIPMASNLQMIFYRNKAGDVLVKFLYQEKETLLRGLEPFEGPYYRWEDVKNNIEGYRR